MIIPCLNPENVVIPVSLHPSLYRRLDEEAQHLGTTIEAVTQALIRHGLDDGFIRRTELTMEWPAHGTATR